MRLLRPQERVKEETEAKGSALIPEGLPVFARLSQGVMFSQNTMGFNLNPPEGNHRWSRIPSRKQEWLRVALRDA